MATPQQHHGGGAQQREPATGHETTFTPSSGVPFQITYMPGGKIRISGELTSQERADEFIGAIQALKLFMVRSDLLRPSSDEQLPKDDPALRGIEESSWQASVSLMITQQQKDTLRELGYTDDQIRDMKPEDAHRVLGLTNHAREA